MEKFVEEVRTIFLGFQRGEALQRKAKTFSHLATFIRVYIRN